MDVVRVIGVLEEGGGQLSALRLSVGLRGHGFDTVRLLAGDATPGGVALARGYGVEVETFVDPRSGERRGLQWRDDADFADWLAPRLADAELVHAHMVGAWMAAAKVVRPDVALIASEHNAVTWPCGDFTAQAVAAAARIDAFFAHGPAARDFAATIGLLEEVLHEGRSAVEGLDATALPALPTPRLTFAGRLHPEKGADLLVEALALLRTPVNAYLLGDGPAAAQLANRVRELGLAGSVRFVGWSPEPARYIAGASVHVVPSREEAWSQSAVIGLGLGVPVVGTAVEGLPFTLGEGRGLLVPREDPAALARAIDAVLDGSSRPDPAPGRAYAAQFTIAAVSATYARVYASSASSRRS
ncbi:MAG: glycosyltransferase [Geodermatophilaceae bacterium]|nr:glycosyltransferase [Geodermatophilaceae bacterium]MDQ3465118.1 glycosyltransferase [Actinomycetota bacterium]